MLDLIIPFYNPVPGWERAIVSNLNRLISDYFDGDKQYIHVIIINDGSAHGFTSKEILFLEQHLLHVKVISYTENKGKGFALRMGVAASRNDYCIYSDDDFPFGLAVIRQMYEALRAGADIVTGCRTEGNYFGHLPFKRKLISKTLAVVNKHVLRLSVADTQAGIKGFNKLGKALFSRTTINSFLFDMEFIRLACKMSGVKIQQIKVNLMKDTKMTNFSNKVIKQELGNFMRIMVKRNKQSNPGKILFSIDLEEFDMPEEQNQKLPLQTKLEVSMEGMHKLQELMNMHHVSCTVFSTAFWAQHYPDYIRTLSQQHEIASHTFYHEHFESEDLIKSRIVLSSITGKEVKGIRMPRMQAIDAATIAAAGYTYDSSLHPTWLPGHYNHFNRERTFYRQGNLWVLPASVTPMLRVPVFWLSLKNFPLRLYKHLCRTILKKDGYLVIYVHPWEFTDLSAYKLPSIVKGVDGNNLLTKLHHLFSFFSSEGCTFDTHEHFIENLTQPKLYKQK